ncbi:MAG: trypsin-like peptidase domain-containing protein [Anaeromassilibacillus sp.]
MVCIQNYQRSNNNSMFFFGGGAQNGDAGDEVSPVSEGSGIIATSDGYIITNAHVVEGASSLKVILSDGTSYEAQLVGSDSITDWPSLRSIQLVCKPQNLVPPAIWRLATASWQSATRAAWNCLQCDAGHRFRPEPPDYQQ